MSFFTSSLLRPRISIGGFLLASVLLCTPLWALNPVPYTEGVSFSFQITGSASATLTVNDDAGSPSVVATSAGTLTESLTDIAWLRPGKLYSLNFAGNAAVTYALSFLTPSGYSIYVDEIPMDLVAGSHSGSFSDNHQIELRPVASSARGDAASFSGIEIGKSVTWNIGLGGLRSGSSAGRILFKELDLLTNAPDSRERLYYAPPGNIGQIQVVTDVAAPYALQQIGVPQTVVDLVDDLTYGGYWINFYAASQATWGGTSYTFTGSPWKTIRVESPGTSQLKITETEGSVSRVSKIDLTSGSIASGVYQWTLQEGDGSTWLRTTTHTSSIPAADQRDDVVVVRTGGTSGTIVAKTKYHYFGPASPQTWGEEITEVVADPDTAALTTSYAYYTTSADHVNYRKIKSVTAPTGAWGSYLYFDDWDRRGQLAVETRPWLDTHSSVQAAAITVDNSVVHDYVADFTGRFRIESARQNYITNVLAGATATTPTINQTQDGQMYTLYATDASAGTSLTQHSESAIIDAGNGINNPDYYGQPYSVKRPDSSQDSYTHHTGDFNYSTKVFTSPANWSHFRTTAFHGTTSSSGTDSYTAYDGLTVAQIYLVPNRSTKDVTVRNPAGDIVRTETHIYTGSGSFTLMTWEDFIYDDAGRLLIRIASNGASLHNTYTNGQLTSTEGVDGTETQFTYDLIGRVVTSVKKGAAVLGSYAAQGDITTTNTYDGAGHVVQAVSAGGALSQTTTATYDLAGRLTQTVAPGGYTTTFAYSSGGKIVTATLPGGATKITETYLDGQGKSVSGTAVVAEDDTFSLDGAGNQVRRSVFGGNTTGWTDLSRDWLGRPIDQASPGWNGTTVHQTSVYNSAGQLARATRPSLADTLYLYDILGRRPTAKPTPARAAPPRPRPPWPTMP
jgi:YD repeat-containing protein